MAVFGFRLAGLSAWIAFVCMLSVPAFAQAAKGENTNESDRLVAEALSRNPELKSLDHRIEALRYQSEAVQRWMDPVFAVEYSNFPWDTWQLGDSPMSGVQFKLQQTFPLAGKNSRREATLRAEGDAARHALDEKRNRLATEIRRGYWSLALVRALRAVTEKHIQLTAQLVEAVRGNYQVGRAGQHDLLRLEVLKSKLKDDLGDFTRRERELVASLNGALHRDSETAIETPQQLEKTPFAMKDADALMALAKERRAVLKEISTRARARRLAADQAAYERWPDITLWAGYRIRREAGMDDGTDQMTLGLSIPLPFDYTGHSAAARDADLAQAQSLDEQESAALDEIRAGIESTLAAWKRADEKAASYTETLIPAANRTLESTQAAYQSDRSDFASLYQTQLQLLEFERARLMAVAETHIQKTNLDGLLGVATEPDRLNGSHE